MSIQQNFLSLHLFITITSRPYLIISLNILFKISTNIEFIRSIFPTKPYKLTIITKNKT